MSFFKLNHCSSGFREVCLFGSCAVILALLRWWPLCLGYGLVGGDIYTYYLPLKVWYGDRLHHGEIALWNPLVGNGVPSLGESQTGVFYPLNLILYGFFPVHVAYNASFLLHYILSFTFACLYLRRLGLRAGGAIFGSLVFVYGWFPARNCLEWAIVTGAWMPLVLWGVEGMLTESRYRWGLVTAFGLAAQLLAGHFNLAFITLLCVALYAPLRCLGLGVWPRVALRRLAGVVVCLGLGTSMAAIQLIPSWELKARSQRGQLGGASHNLGYGRLPPWYLAQIVVPWLFYTEVPTMEAPAGQLDRQLGAANTNRAEAHLYFGLIPLVLFAVAVMAVRRHRMLWIWLVLGLGSLAMVSGWWTGPLGGLPGFGYFTGPGRYGIVTQLAVAVGAGVGFQALAARRALPAWRWGVIALVLVITWVDLQWATQSVQYPDPVQIPPVKLRDRSPVARFLKNSDRLLSRNQNAMSLCGVATLPVYLGIGPAEYFREPTMLPREFTWDGAMSRPVLEWLRAAGVTHILAFENHRDWPVELIWRGTDDMLHSMLGRPRDQPLWLYRLEGSLGRAYAVRHEPEVANESSGALPVIPGAIKEIVVPANRVEIVVQLAEAATVVLTDLFYPGWQVEVDGQAAQAIIWRRMYRAVQVGAGQHTIIWKYRPWTAGAGALVSALSMGIALVGGLAFRKGA